MEQSDTADLPSTVLPRRPQTLQSSLPAKTSASRLTNSEPSPPLSNLDDLSNSVPSLRFPRPLGNRQLTNWVSSSSPDIMHPGNIPDDDPSLAELGYDVIGTDGESQAESTTSSFDYQRPDDVQSLAGTDIGTDDDTNEADTDSSEDEEETTLDDTAVSSNPPIEDGGIAEHDEADIETLANRSLENPTNFSQHGFLPFHSMAYAEQLTTMGQSRSTQVMKSEDKKDDASSPAPAETPSRRHEVEADLPYEVYRLVYNHIRDNRRVLIILSGFVVLYGLAMAGKSFLFSSPAPGELATVPVASVASIVIPISTLRTPLAAPAFIPTPATTQTHKALQTDSTSNGLAFMSFGKDKAPIDTVNISQQTICSVDIHRRNEIMVTIPQDIKSTWLARDAIFIAVSRGIQDISTKVTSVSEGFLIEVPSKEAYGTVAVSIATTRKPKVNETFHVNFGNHMLMEAFDAGKQLVKGFAQKVVDTVNGTTAWVEETYIPALDIMSKQVCGQTASFSDSLLEGVRDAGNAVFTIPARLTSEVVAHVRQALAEDIIGQRTGQVQLELARQAQDVRDELALTLLRAQLGSKLLWLKMQGKTQEYQRYLGKAEVYWEEKRADADLARRERVEKVKKQIRAQRKQPARPAREARRSFWNKGAGVY
ncbi:hypothetical protein F5X99DRAFT_55840 [Biscogniauxia marginata]|nr:hypothetical protein F5X99DRAFT_55840 [Biscogniauxia marginata]